MPDRRSPFSLLAGIGLAACACLTFAAEIVIEPRIPPGYEPVDAETEKGLWLEFEEYEQGLRQSALLVRDDAINEYVRAAACRVAGEYCNDIRIYIIRNPNFNASMSANGVMQVWTGLLVRVASEDELAAVLGHELAHYTQLHSLERVRAIRRKMATGSIIDVFIGLPIGQLSAIASVLAFNREQETEADLLGARFMAQSGYDPDAAVRVWRMIVEEEQSAVAKSEEPSMFSRTHPASADRIEALEQYIVDALPETGARAPVRHRHIEILNRYYTMLMEDQLDTNRFGRTRYILETHRKLGVEESLIDYFEGEMYRQRKAEGDLELAQIAYERAIRAQQPLPEAFRNLGYVLLKRGKEAEARAHFRRYLESKPDADDRAMIEFYL